MILKHNELNYQDNLNKFSYNFFRIVIGTPASSALHTLQQNKRKFESNYFTDQTRKNTHRRFRKSKNDENKTTFKTSTQVIDNDFGRRKQVKILKLNLFSFIRFYSSGKQ